VILIQMLRTLPTTPLLSGLQFGEGPRWHDGRLWLSDIDGGSVLTVDAGGAATVVARLQRPSGLGFLPGGDPVVVGMRTRKVFRLHDGTLTEFADLSPCGESFNDLVVLPNGFSYVDCYRPGPPVAPVTGPDGHPRAIGADINRYYVNGLGTSPSIDGAIALISPEGQVRLVASEINYPNAMVVTPDLRTLIVSVSHDSQLIAFDIEPDGGLGNRRLWADLPGRHPDGICLDAEGAIWVSSVATSAWIRVVPGGQITHHIPTAPDRWAVAVALGGPDGRTLFLVSADPIGSALRRSWVDTAAAEVPRAGFP
jgi:sugar lactone lactonase YvrE